MTTSSWSAARCWRPARRRRAGSTCSASGVHSTKSSHGRCWPPAPPRGSASACTATNSAPAQGIRLAVEMGAASVDHCTYFDDTDIEALAASETVATFLPATDFSTRQPYPDARRMIDAGARVAIATNTNPGSSNTTSMSFCIALAVREMGMTIEEAVAAATLGGAGALRRDDLGFLAPRGPRRRDHPGCDVLHRSRLSPRGAPGRRGHSRGGASRRRAGLAGRAGPPGRRGELLAPSPGGSLQRPSRAFSSPADVATISVGVTPTSKRLPYMPGVDGLRALAVLAVFVYHSATGSAGCRAASSASTSSS